MRSGWQRAAVLTLGAAVFGLTSVAASTTNIPVDLEQRAPTLLRSFAELANVTDDEDIDAPVSAGTIDDGGERLSDATITVDEAIAAAQTAAAGPIGEIDLEDYRGTLVFNVDVGTSDVKVDAATGDVLATDSDD